MGLFRRLAIACAKVEEGLYSRTKYVAKIILNPKMTEGVTYYPEKPRKSKLSIWMDYLSDAFKYGSVDAYYYEYGRDILDVRGGGYVIYPEFMHKRAQHNISEGGWELCLLRDKFFFGMVAHTLGVRTPPVIALIKNGKVLKNISGRYVLSTWDEFVNVLDGTYYVKAIDGECGRGVTRLAVDGEEMKANGEQLQRSSLDGYFGNGTYIVQPAINQHPDMDKLYPGCVCTIRIITVRDNNSGGIVVLPAYQRIGVNGSHVDNTSQGGVFVGINEDGTLKEYGFFKPQFGTKTNKHPQTGVSFSGFAIPFFKEAKEMAIKFHTFLKLHSIGWDIAITEDGPVFIEGNDNWEINDIQCTHGPMRQVFNRYF